ncbi:myoneurin-like [Culicoides brevitarsis]|uniref:myoneurin-like n=1 Tax=Culicoides brevitarsis TaxID=469753 RepID=UPI00307B6644
MEVLETTMPQETLASQEMPEDVSQVSTETVKIESLISLNECCISCLAESNAEQKPLRKDREIIQIYKEFVNRHIESKVKEIPIAFCDPCCNLLETLKNFKTTCLESLNVLEDLISEKRAEEQKYDEQLPLKVEVESDESDVEDDRSSSDEEFIPDIKAELKEPEDEEFLEMNDDDEDDEQQPKAKRRKRNKKDRTTTSSGKNCHICKECGKGFPRPANLRNHFLKKHRGAKHCKYCQKAFEDEEEYNAHMDMEEKRVKLKKETCQKIHVCEVCGLTTRFRSNLVKHMDTHLPDPNAIKCEVCGKGFKSLILLKNHIGYHKEKTFVCVERDCDKKFLFAKDLERHIRLVHLKAAEYTECSICNKRLTIKGLNSHVKQVHMDIRPHICSICGMAFKSSSNIKKHMYSHSGTRPFNCHICGQGTYMTCTLKEHYNKAHGLQMTTAELNKVCVKLPPEPINAPLSPNTQQTVEIMQQHPQDPNTMISITGINENVVESTIMSTITSPVNLAK